MRVLLLAAAAAAAPGDPSPCDSPADPAAPRWCAQAAQLLDWGQAAGVLPPNARQQLEVRLVSADGAAAPDGAAGQWGLFARAELPADALLLRYPLRTGSAVRSQPAAAALLSGPRRHQTASTLVRELAEQRAEPGRSQSPRGAASRAGDGPSGAAGEDVPTTPFVIPSHLSDDAAVHDFAAGLELARMLAADTGDGGGPSGWARWLREGVNCTAAALSAEEAERVAPAAAEERAAAGSAAKAWHAAAQKLARQGAIPAGDVPEEAALAAAWQVINARGLRAPPPHGTIIGPHAVFLRQAPADPAAPGVLGLGLAEAEDGEVWIAARTAAPVAKGQEFFLPYAAEQGLSPQQLLLQYGVWHPSPSAAWGIHYHISPDEVDADPSGALKQHGCAMGEVTVNSAGVVTEHALQCFRLHQLPETVRHDHRELLRGRKAKADALALLSNYAAQVLKRLYGADAEVYDFSEVDGSNPPVMPSPEQDAAPGQGNEEDMPEELQRLIREAEKRDAEAAAKRQAEATADAEAAAEPAAEPAAAAEEEAKAAEVCTDCEAGGGAADKEEEGPAPPPLSHGAELMRGRLAEAADALAALRDSAKKEALRIYKDLQDRQVKEMQALAAETQARTRRVLEELEIDRMPRDEGGGEEDEIGLREARPEDLHPQG